MRSPSAQSPICHYKCGSGPASRLRPVRQPCCSTMPRLPAAILLGLLTLLAVVVARTASPNGVWLCLPVAAGVAALAPSARSGLAWALWVLAAAALAGLPEATPALLAAPATLLVVQFARVRLERERDAMRRYALRDPLTGLANRRALEERLAYEVLRHERRAEPFTVVVLDLDRFKAVNDRFGHEAGDELLRDVGAALVGAVRAQDTVARMGGDEFCVLAPQTGPAGADQLLVRIAHGLAKVTAGLQGVTACSGAATFPADGRRPQELLAAADMAAIAAKRRRPGEARRRAA